MKPSLTIGHHAVSSAPVLWELETTPHLLITGRTGSGKSVLAKTLVAQAAMQGLLTFGLYEDHPRAHGGTAEETLRELIAQAYSGGYATPALIVLDGYSIFSTVFAEALQELVQVSLFTGARYHLAVTDQQPGPVERDFLGHFTSRVTLSPQASDEKYFARGAVLPEMLSGEPQRAVFEERRLSRVTYVDLQAPGELYSTLLLRRP